MMLLLFSLRCRKVVLMLISSSLTFPFHARSILIVHRSCWQSVSLRLVDSRK